MTEPGKEYTVYLLLRHGIIVSTSHNKLILKRWAKDYGNVPSYDVQEVSFTL